MSEHFEYDPDKLIDEVKKRPGLWDPSHQDYRPKQTRAKLWHEIVTEIIGDAELSKSDKRELELQIQKKWKGYRDTFLKYITHPEKWKHPYMHSQRLQFLLKCIQTKSSKSIPNDVADAASSESDEEYRAKIDWRQKKKKIKLARESDNDDEFDAPCDNSESFIEAPQMTSVSGSRPCGEDFIFANVDSHSRNDYDDPDKMFLLSLLPHLKAVPERCRLNVKMDMMQVLRNAQYNN